MIKHFNNLPINNNEVNTICNDRAPSDYKNDIVGDMKEIMESAICPENSLDLKYDEFVNLRSTMLLDYANKLI